MLNRITIGGRMAQTPELRSTQSGIDVVRFSVACERDYPTKAGEREVDFIPCVAWRGTAEYIYRFFTKGQKIIIDGRLQTRKYMTQDGRNQTAFEILVDTAYFGDSKNNIADSGKEIEDGDGDFFSQLPEGDDLPF